MVFGGQIPGLMQVGYIERNQWLSASEVNQKADSKVVCITNLERYPGQRIFVVNIVGYAKLIPFVEDDEEVFLKTIIPSRKATDTYLRHGESNG